MDAQDAAGSRSTENDTTAPNGPVAVLPADTRTLSSGAGLTEACKEVARKSQVFELPFEPLHRIRPVAATVTLSEVIVTCKEFEKKRDSKEAYLNLHTYVPEPYGRRRTRKALEYPA